MVRAPCGAVAPPRQRRRLLFWGRAARPVTLAWGSTTRGKPHPYQHLDKNNQIGYIRHPSRTDPGERRERGGLASPACPACLAGARWTLVSGGRPPARCEDAGVRRASTPRNCPRKLGVCPDGRRQGWARPATASHARADRGMRDPACPLQILSRKPRPSGSGTSRRRPARPLVSFRPFPALARGRLRLPAFRARVRRPAGSSRRAPVPGSRAAAWPCSPRHRVCRGPPARLRAGRSPAAS